MEAIDSMLLAEEWSTYGTHLVRRCEVGSLVGMLRALRPPLPQHSPPLPRKVYHGGGYPADSRPHPSILEGSDHLERQNRASTAVGLVQAKDEGVQPTTWFLFDSEGKRGLWKTIIRATWPFRNVRKETGREVFRQPDTRIPTICSRCPMLQCTPHLLPQVHTLIA